MKHVIVIAVLLMSVFSAVIMPVVDAEADSYVLEMNVDDTFTYAPETNMMDHTTFYVSGTAMIGEGGFLVFSAGTIEGVADRAGEFTVDIMAVWQLEDLQQIVYQHIVLDVSEASISSPMNKTLTYGAAGWDLSSQPLGSSVQAEESSDEGFSLFRLPIIHILGILGAVVVISIVIRAVL